MIQSASNQAAAWRLQVAQAIAAGLGDQWTVEACAERCRRQIETGVELLRGRAAG